MLKQLPGHFKVPSQKVEEPPFLFTYNEKVAKATFNRPQALNSFNHKMMELLQNEVPKWNAKKDLQVVIFNNNGGKSFCAGGDLKPLYYASVKSDADFTSSYFTGLFRVSHSVATMKPIQIALWDGMVIGIGGGLTLNAPIKVATENTKFSMPGIFIPFLSFC